MGDTEMELVSTCSTQWSPVHLPKISHSISVIIANFDLRHGIILFVLSFYT